MFRYGLAFLIGKIAMQVNRRRSYARLLNGTVLGFVVMLGLLALTTFLLIDVRTELDLAVADDAVVAAALAQETQARTDAERQVASLEQLRVAMQQQVDAARIAKGVAEEATQREMAVRMAAEQESINQETAKVEAQRLVEQERQARIAAEEAKEEAEEATEEARRQMSREILARQRAERQLETGRTQAETALARERAMAHLVTRGIVTGLVTYTVDDLPGYAAEGVDAVVVEVNTNLAEWTTLGFNVSLSGPSEEPDFTIGWMREAAGPENPVPGETNRVLVPLGEMNCVGEWVPYDAPTVHRLLWHELGHVFGYGNSDDAANVMHAELPIRFAEQDRTVELVLAPNITHLVPLCGAGTFTFVFQPPEPGQGYQFAVLKPDVTQEDGYFDDDNHYPDCGSGPDLFTNECIVEEGARLLVYTQVAITRITATITKAVDELPEITMEWDPAAFRYTDADLDALRDL